MTDGRVEISVKGRMVTVPSTRVGDHTVCVAPGFIRIAEVKDEAWLAGDVVSDPEAFVRQLEGERLGADLFTFTQKPPNTTPRYPYPMEWDNVAAIVTADFASWWDRVPQETRKNVRRAGRRGVTVREVRLDPALLRGIVAINNETPVRQGRAFWHFGKSLAEVERDYTTLIDRSLYLGAYHGDELVGFVKLVHMGAIGGILQLLCKPSHYDKRPANALLARAVEWSCAQGFTHLVYGQYEYGTRRHSPLMEFKRRNGFEPVRFPRYYVPLTARGRLALALGLHHGWHALLPTRVMDLALRARSVWYRRRSPRDTAREAEATARD